VIQDGRFDLIDDETEKLLGAFHIPVATDTIISGQSAGDKLTRAVSIGILRDPIFGPVIRFDQTGTAGPMDADTRLALPPLNNYLARELIQDTLDGERIEHVGDDAGQGALIETLGRVSEMACELPAIQELEITLRVSGEATAVAARVTVAAPGTNAQRYGHMAVHPYPAGLETTWQLADQIDVVVRPIRPEDATVERRFVDGLSAESKYFRFMNHMDKISPLLLARFTQIDYDREMALVVVLGENTTEVTIIAGARYISHPDRQSCEFALTVADGWQKHGIGHRLMERLMAIARERGLEVMEGDVLAQNSKMLRLCSSLGFQTLHDDQDSEIVIVRRDL
jgi:acetyltransferase